MWKQLKATGPIQIFILLMVVALAIGLVKYFSLNTELVTIRLEVKGRQWSEDFTGGTGYQPPSWLVQAIAVGDSERSVGGSKIAEILRVESYGDRTPVTILTTQLKTVKSGRTGKLAYKNQGVEVGSFLELSLTKVKVSGQITAILEPGKSAAAKTVFVKGRLRNAEAWLVDKIVVGDEMKNQADETAVAKVIEKQVEAPTSIIFYSNPNNLNFTERFLERNSRLSDVILTLRLRVERFGNDWWFAGNQLLKVGDTRYPLQLYFEDYNLRYFEIQDFWDEK